MLKLVSPGQAHPTQLQGLTGLVMLQSGSEPRFGPEPFWTGPKSSPRFSIVPELNWKSGSRFRRGPNVVNPVQTELDPEPEGTVLTAATVLQGALRNKSSVTHLILTLVLCWSDSELAAHAIALKIYSPWSHTSGGLALNNTLSSIISACISCKLYIFVLIQVNSHVKVAHMPSSPVFILCTWCMTTPCMCPQTQT